MPLTPLLLAYMAIGFTNYRYVKLFSFANIILAFYLSLIHQTGPYAAIKYLSSNSQDSRGILFLTPCHGTPLYSHLHWDIPTRFLECPPDLGTEHRPQDDESSRFHQDPLMWLHKNIELNNYDHMVVF